MIICIGRSGHRPRLTHTKGFWAVASALLCWACGAGGTPVPSGGRAGTGGQGGVVHPETGAPCTTGADCAPPQPFCDKVNGHCVECIVAKNCPTAGSLCRADDHKCVTCNSVSDCSASLPYCSFEGKCVQCIATSNCGSPEASCDPVTSRCVPKCETDADCSGALDRPLCDPKLHMCVQCQEDTQCTPGRSCLDPGGVCVDCQSDGDCFAEMPYCNVELNHTCVQCRSNADCVPGQSCLNWKCVAPPATPVAK